MKAFSFSAGIAAIILTGGAVYMLNQKSEPVAQNNPLHATQPVAERAAPDNTITASVSIPQQEITQKVRIVR